MKFVVLGIRIENVGSRDLTSDELSRNPPFKDLVLVTNTGRDYRLSSFPASPYIVPAPQNECMEHNAILINSARSKTFYVLKQVSIWRIQCLSLFYKMRSLLNCSSLKMVGL